MEENEWLSKKEIEKIGFLKEEKDYCVFFDFSKQKIKQAKRIVRLGEKVVLRIFKIEESIYLLLIQKKIKGEKNIGDVSKSNKQSRTKENEIAYEIYHNLRIGESFFVGEELKQTNIHIYLRNLCFRGDSNKKYYYRKVEGGGGNFFRKYSSWETDYGEEVPRWNVQPKPKDFIDGLLDGLVELD